MGARRLATDAMLAGIAIAVYIIELQIPALVPIPGVKLGLANIVTLFAIYLIGGRDATGILLVRIFLGCLLTGRFMALLYSLTGGIFCLAVMLFLKRIVTKKQIWVCSVFGAVAHNIGQVIVAILLTRTPELAFYFPPLLVSGILTGLFTGFCAQYVILRLGGSGESESSSGSGD